MDWTYPLIGVLFIVPMIGILGFCFWQMLEEAAETETDPCTWCGRE